jgi:acetolactate synthase-1/2/3 large subunit
MGAMQELDAPRLVREHTKWARTVHDVSRLGEYVDLACRAALSGRPGPVLLEVPSDLMFQTPDPYQRDQSLRPLVRPSRTVPEPAATDAVVQAIIAAKRPLIIAGNGAYWGHAGDALRRLASDFRIPVMGKALGRGLVPEDMETGFPWAYAQLAAPQADLVILAGTRINATLSYANPLRFDPDATFVQIDIEPEEIGRNHHIDHPLVGDAGFALAAIADGLAARGYRGLGTPRWVNAALTERDNRLARVGAESNGKVHPVHQARELAGRLPADAIVVGDGAACLNWFNAVLRVQQSPGWLDHSPFGCMGVGVPFAIGAVAAEQDRARAQGGPERPVYLVTGDGSFSFYLAELATASYYGLPFFGMISNDGAWGANRVNQKRNLGRNYGTHLAPSRYDLVAQGLDCAGEYVERPADVGPAIDRALDAVRSGKPAIVNVMCDPEVPEVLRDEPLLSMGGATGTLRSPVSRKSPDA